MSADGRSRPPAVGVKKERLKEPAEMHQTSEPFSKIMSPEELGEALDRLQADEKLRVEKKEK